MRDALKSYLALAGGVTEITRQRAVEAAKALVASGEAAAEQVTGLAEDLLTQTRHNREAVVALVGFEVDRVLGRVGLASADEVTSLTERVRALERRLAEQSDAASGASGPTAGGGAAARAGGAASAARAGGAASAAKGAPKNAAAGSGAAKGGSAGGAAKGGPAAAGKGRSGGTAKATRATSAPGAPPRAKNEGVSKRAGGKAGV